MPEYDLGSVRLFGRTGANEGQNESFAYTEVNTYYTAHLWQGRCTSIDLQRITNRGYNRERGPIPVSGVRLHVDF